MSAALSLDDLDACDPRHPRKAVETDCCCPLCGPTMGKKADSAHRCFSYNRQTGKWHCHRCGESGLLTDFRKERTDRMYADSTTYRERSQRDLKTRFALSNPSTATATTGKDIGAPGSDINSAPKTAEDAAAERSSRWAMLTQNLQPLDGTPGAVYLEARGLPVAFCHAADVRFSPKWLGFPSAVFPLRTAPLLPNTAGKLIAAQGRAIVDTKGKVNKRTYNRREGSMGVFATPGAWEEKTLTLTEAPIDALSLALAGVPALAICGKELGAARSEWLLPRFYGCHVLLAFDADEAGDAASVKIAAELRAVGALSVKRLRPEGAKDWNAALLGMGADALGKYLAGEGREPANLRSADDREEWESIRALGESFDADLRRQEVEREQELESQEDDAEYGERLRAAYMAARAGQMPVDQVVSIDGAKISSPGAWFVQTVQRLQRIRQGVPAQLSQDAYLRLTVRERAALDVVAEWWEQVCSVGFEAET